MRRSIKWIDSSTTSTIKLILSPLIMISFILYSKRPSSMLEEDKISSQTSIGIRILLSDAYILAKYWVMLMEKWFLKQMSSIHFLKVFKEVQRLELVEICMPFLQLIVQQMVAEEILHLETEEFWLNKMRMEDYTNTKAKNISIPELTEVHWLGQVYIF